MMEKLTDLNAEYVAEIKFSEVDLLKIVWHGHYIRYFEDAREAFGKKYGIGYMDILDQGYTIPVVQLNCNYKASLKYGDVIVIKCSFIDTLSAKIVFQYQIRHQDTGQIVAEGRTVQVFLDMNGELQLYTPQYILDWKKKYNLI